MSLATSNRDGGRTNEAGHLRGVTKGFLGQVLSGLAVSQRGAGANMSVDVAIGDAIIVRSDNTYGHPSWNDAVYNQVVAAADGSNPRRDIIVMYIDYNQAPSTGIANNTNGVVKITSVAGTAAGSPVDPSNATIQSAVGSGNPWIKLARVRVAAGATSISNSVIDDLRLMATAQPQGGWLHDATYTWVYGSATTFTIAGVDLTAQFPVGTKLRIYQSGSVKYFYVVSSAFSTNTTVTVSGGGTYTVANVPIDRPAYSYDNTPSGYPSSLLNIPNNYSTTEQDTGTRWIDGKTIYRKVVNFGALPNNTSKTVAHGIVGWENFIRIYGWAKTGTVVVPLPFVSSSALSAAMSLNINNTTIDITAGSDRSAFSGYIVLEYTKT